VGTSCVEVIIGLNVDDVAATRLDQGVTPRVTKTLTTVIIACCCVALLGTSVVGRKHHPGLKAPLGPFISLL
jgi:hypothetical protein